MLPLDPGPRAVRDELHRAVQRDGYEGLEVEQHDGEQSDAPRHADDGREDRGEERRHQQDRAGGELQSSGSQGLQRGPPLGDVIFRLPPATAPRIATGA